MAWEGTMDVPVIEQIKIQAQVLVPLVKALLPAAPSVLRVNGGQAWRASLPW